MDRQEVVFPPCKEKPSFYGRRRWSPARQFTLASNRYKLKWRPAAPAVMQIGCHRTKPASGTSYTTASNVWFTLQDGRLSELYYPDLSTTSVRNLDFVVTVGLLLEIKEVVQGASRPGQIPVGDKRRYNFVQIAGPLGKRPAKTGSGLALQKV